MNLYEIAEELFRVFDLYCDDHDSATAIEHAVDDVLADTALELDATELSASLVAYDIANAGLDLFGILDVLKELTE